MKIQVLALGVLCAGALSLVAVQAEEAVAKEAVKGDKEKSRFEMADTDGNGSVSLEEFKVVFAKRPPRPVKDGEVAPPAPTAEDVFNKLDTDKSGSLSKEEMKAGHKGPRDGKKGQKKAEDKAAK